MSTVPITKPFFIIISFNQVRTWPAAERSECCAPPGVCFQRHVHLSGGMMLFFFSLCFQPQDEVFRLATSLGNLGLEPGTPLWMGDDCEPGWPGLLHQVGRTDAMNSELFAFSMSLFQAMTQSVSFALGSQRRWEAITQSILISCVFYVFRHEVASSLVVCPVRVIRRGVVRAFWDGETVFSSKSEASCTRCLRLELKCDMEV